MFSANAFRSYFVVSLVGSLAVLGGCDLSQQQIQLASTDAPTHLGVGRLKMLGTSSSAILKPEFDTVASAVIKVIGAEIIDIDGTVYQFEIAPFALDLMTLKEGLGTSLLRVKLPEGQFEQIRLITEAQGLLTFTEGNSVAFDIPSGEQSGLKIFTDHPFRISEDQISVAILAADVSNSFVFTGNGTVHFKPVLQISVSEPIALPQPDASPSPSPSPEPEPSPTPSPTDTVTIPDSGTTDPGALLTPGDSSGTDFGGWIGV